MNLINKKQEKILIKFFKVNIQPLVCEKHQFKDPPLVNQASYYVSGKGNILAPQDFELRLDNRVSISRTLDEFWKESPLKGLGRKFVKLSKYFPVSQGESEVSSSIYEMF
ncbi:MAG: hypothetical protein SVR94_08465 [Pseudomonadota bacterium]|nr:hypothetical protein [Pseudomonadota bacterium]